MTGKTPKTNKRSQLIVLFPETAPAARRTLKGRCDVCGGTVMIKARVADHEGR